eukprot:4936798-Pyramimonas_sp.AAC.2
MGSSRRVAHCCDWQSVASGEEVWRGIIHAPPQCACLCHCALLLLARASRRGAASCGPRRFRRGLRLDRGDA